MSTPLQLLHLDEVGSTQAEVLDRLARMHAGGLIAVASRSQRAGRGRQGRRWVDAPGGGVALSVGLRGPAPVSMLEQLPRRVATCVLELVAAGEALAWKAPNDLVARDGAKVAGILVDARSVDEHVEHVVVGVGINVGGDAFTTPDGRSATTLAALDCTLDVDELARRIAAQLSARP